MLHALAVIDSRCGRTEEASGVRIEEGLERRVIG